jgi:hypothetical protein
VSDDLIFLNYELIHHCSRLDTSSHVTSRSNSQPFSDIGDVSHRREAGAEFKKTVPEKRKRIDVESDESEDDIEDDSEDDMQV